MSRADVQYLVSIHDVMPSTLDQTEAIVDRLLNIRSMPITLLVVPGTGWEQDGIDRLRRLIDRGAVLAGHGWCHKVKAIRGLKHRLHSLFLSRDVAEHLALSADEAVALMQRCYDWFVQHELPAPELYVPPAWAMGAVSRAQLNRLPFKQFETFAGVYDSVHHRFCWLPMMGFEADTKLRKWFVHGWNSVNLFWGSSQRKPIRLGIHPNDFDLRLGGDLEQRLQALDHCIDYYKLVRP